MSTDREKETRRLIQKGQIILDEMAKQEPAQNEVFASHSNEIKIVYEGKDFSLSTSHSSSMYGIRTILQGRLGFMTTNSDGEDALKKVAKEVQQIARLSPESPYHQVTPKLVTNGHFENFDPKIAEMAPKSMYAYAEKVVNEAQRDHRIAIDRAEFSWTVSSWMVMNSLGVSQSAVASAASWFAMGMAKTDTEVTSFDWEGGTVTHESQLMPEIEKTMANFRDSTVYCLGAKKGKSYRGPVLLHPQAVMDLIGGFVAANCNGLRQQDGMSSWKGKLGETVASIQLRVFEDPLNAQRAEGWLPFDREGTPTNHHNLIHDGKLSFVAHNCFSAKRGGAAPTGNSMGGARSLPSIGFSNLAVQGSGDLLDDAQMMKVMDHGLVLKRFSGNEDMASGQFSGVAKNSWWVENGHRAYPVHEVMISGNLFEVLKSILKVGKTQYKLTGGGLAPYILVDGLNVTAG